ncbi:hypothetical protein [Deinococcus aquiradiocola]|uniref:Uncharacterized protein n=1 Tax=Deinococcus aquiradiocola TaxID=393059 RepID=A0A917P3U7_9DEIO|nr:hypothetical protein [Deinococcus aquiradiocola]GGJ60277.1 hypothetical protein GCM10008939_00030 [Deinococcus aquiradiocola]
MSSVALRTTFVLNALLFVPAGLLVYFLPLGTLGVNPLWLGRVAGALLLAWGVSMAYGAWRPVGAAVVQFVTGNLLLAATLVPAALRASMPGTLRTALVAVGVALAVLAVLALVLPRPRTGDLR